MKCPYCGHLENKVVDSRLNKDYTITRRRRACLSCGSRFTTYERLEVTVPMMVKKDGRREPWDRDKILNGLRKACEKRPVSISQIENFVERLEQQFQDMGEKEVSVRLVGARIMEMLRDTDEVAYVRFASVYRHFKDINEFMDELKLLLNNKDEQGSNRP
ncbi:MAG: transcriptional regulator NrdR [Thermodesulfobacteriota bacterium]